MEEMLKKVIIIAEEAGEEIKKYFGQILEVEEKSMASDVRTKADFASEKIIIDQLIKTFPDYNIFSEEAGEIKKGSDFTFIVDPLDGTNNFSLGLANFSVSIGLTKNDEIVFGVVRNPITNQTFYAEKGKGAFENGRKIEVNSEEKIERSSISCIFAYRAEIEDHIGLTNKFERAGAKRVLQNWSPALDFCLLASGKIEAIIQNPTEIYDYIAGKLIAIEAGARTTMFDGLPEENELGDKFVISNDTRLHEKILNIFK